MSSAGTGRTIDLRTTPAAGVASVGVDDDCPSGAAAAFALLATIGTGAGVLAGALIF